jgi:nucleoside-diphosphate-sugar epimerase
LGPSLTNLPLALDAVVYTAAAAASTPEAYRAAYLDGPRNLMKSLEGSSAAPRRIVFASSTAVWGESGGGWVDEDTPSMPDTFRGEILLEGEEGLRAAGLSAVSLRLGGIYGPGRTRLLERVRKGEARCPKGDSPAGQIWSNRIHRDDAAGALAHLLTLDEVDPVYVGVDHEPALLCDVYTYLAGLLGVPPPEGVDTDDNRANKRCSSARLRATGFRFEFPTFREGYRAMIEGRAA